jgi:tRNA dimethylallyltransferase
MKPLRVLLGPTAVGKTAVSLPLAEALGAEIVCIDSRQIYRGMEIGSAAPTPEERARVPHHLVAEAAPEDVMSAGEFGRRASAAIEAIRARGREALLVGGSGLYLRATLGGLDEQLPHDALLRESLRARARTEGVAALHAELERLDPVTAARTSPRDAQRVTRALEIIALTGHPVSALRTKARRTEIPARCVVLDREREDLEARIRARVAAMIEAGLVDEVRALLSRGLDPHTPALRSVGYAETIRFLNGDLDRAAWIEAIAVNTRRYAKRQRTWFRGIEGATWVRVAADEPDASVITRVSRAWQIPAG